jgi:hypothetical protein
LLAANDLGRRQYEKEIQTSMSVQDHTEAHKACYLGANPGAGNLYFLEIIMDPHHEEYEEMLEWAGGDFDLERFNRNEVFFDDPDDRFNLDFS